MQHCLNQLNKIEIASMRFKHTDVAITQRLRKRECLYRTTIQENCKRVFHFLIKINVFPHLFAQDVKEEQELVLYHADEISICRLNHI